MRAARPIADGLRRMNRIVSSLRKRARGRTCGECAHYNGGDCLLHEGPVAGPLEVRTAEAVACREWRERI